MDIVTFPSRSQGTYTQTVKRAADNKRRYAPGEGGITACFVVGVLQRGLPLGTRLCSQSVVCYTLCRRCCENAVATGEGKGVPSQNRAVIAWRGAASAGLVSSADRAYMNAPVPRPTPNYGTKCPRRIATLTKKQTDFSLKLKWAGSHFRAFPP